jgi:kanamycin kinase
MSLYPPEPMRTAYAEWSWDVAWEWPEVATTWRLQRPSPDGTRVRFLKVVQTGHYPTALEESARMQWASLFLPVPIVLEAGSGDGVDWLLTDGLAGTDATRHALLGDPARIVPILARGLADFHARAPVAQCPFDFRLTAAIPHARERVRAGIVQPSDLHDQFQPLLLDDAVALLERLRPASEDLVVCHGDYCFPNVLLDDAGAITGYLDLGELGIADRWWDVAIGAWSTTGNVGPGWEDLFYEAYGVERDDERITFYRLLYDLAS